MALQQRTTWTPQLRQRLTHLLEDGLTDHEAGQVLGVTSVAIANARRVHHLPRRDQLLMTTAAVARLFGVNQRTVWNWAEQGYLPGDRRTGRGAHQQWMFTQTHLFAFMEDSRHWHRWAPERLTEARLRRWAEGLRGDVRFLTYPEAAARMCCAVSTVKRWAATGRLGTYRGDCALVREDELLAMALPEIGQGSRKRAWLPCAHCGDPDGPTPSRGRSPGRRDARRFGVEGRVCERCFWRLRLAAERAAREAA